MLSDTDILATRYVGWIDVAPFDATRVQPASYDVTLGERFLVFDDVHGVIDCARDEQMIEARLEPNGSFMLLPGEFALGATVETITLSPSFAAIVAGKSSLARRGLAIESAGFIDPGFSGQITLELANLTRRPLVLWPGMAVGQVAFLALHTPATRPYGVERGSHYQGQRGPTASAVHHQVAELRERGRVGEAPSPR